MERSDPEGPPRYHRPAPLNHDPLPDSPDLCTIHFDELLEAAHIVPDSDPMGVPEVFNGLALCSLHHRGFDRFMVDVDDDYRIRLSVETLGRRDGPLFQRAFLERHGQQIQLPRRTEQEPSLEHLAARRQRRPDVIWAR